MIWPPNCGLGKTVIGLGEQYPAGFSQAACHRRSVDQAQHQLDHWTAANCQCIELQCQITQGWIAEGNYLALLDEPKIPGNSAFELVGYLALATDLDETRRYATIGRTLER